MEDRHSVTHSMLSDEVTVLSVILVLDGHGGLGCAEFVNTELSQRLHAGLHVEGSRTEEDCVIKQAFLDTDRRFLSLFPRDTSGSTALALMVWTRNESILRAVVANAGDCRLVVACKSESKYIAQRITKDHNCDQDSERERIINLGGNLVRDKRGNFRVDGFIKVTRAFGNSGTKRYVFPEPEISPVSLVMGVHDFLVVGSDGLFDNMTDQEVIQTVLDTAKQAGLSAKRLGSEAIARGVTDNVTALVIFLRKWNESGKSDWVAA
jgi:serine/threonine protein phosphatase PrpC